MSSEILAVVWDMDGTLVDTEPLHAVTFQEIAVEYGLHFPVGPSALVGLSLDQLWPLVGGEDQERLTFAEFVKKLNTDYAHKIGPHLLREGIKETLETIASYKRLQACASNAERTVLDANLNNTYIASYFQHTVSRDDVANGKPAPDPYLLACKKLQVDPARCLAIEDTPVGIASARAAGMRTVAFPNLSTHHLDFSYAHERVNHISEILPFLRG